VVGWVDKQKIDKFIAQQRREREILDFKNVLSTDSGKRVIWKLLQLSGFFNEQFKGNSKDFYDLGRRALGCVIHHEVIDASGFTMLDKMQKLEAQEISIEENLRKEMESEE
jgi:hypothetical protein